MRNVIEWTLVSADGVFDESAVPGFLQYQDDAYLRDGLGLMTACEAMLFGRSTYQMFAKLYQGGRVHPWASRLNAIPKYVFSSTLGSADWNNSTLVRGDAVAEVTRLKQQEGGDLLIFGHGLLAETLLRARLTDVIDLSVYPVLAGSGKQFFRDGRQAAARCRQDVLEHREADLPTAALSRPPPIRPNQQVPGETHDHIRPQERRQ